MRERYEIIVRKDQNGTPYGIDLVSDTQVYSLYPKFVTCRGLNGVGISKQTPPEIVELNQLIDYRKLSKI